jgi:hypothetical protein
MIFLTWNPQDVLVSDMAAERFSKQEVFNCTYNCWFIDYSPPPNNYNIKSDFTNTPSNKAISFGIAREAYSKVYIKENPTRDPSVPGPGQYVIPCIVGLEAAKYTMRPKT